MQPQQSKAPRAKRTPFIALEEIETLLALGTSRQQPTAPAAAVDTTPQPVFTAPASLTGIFGIYQQYLAKLAELEAEFRTVERELFGSDWKTVIESPKTQYVRSIAQEAINNLVSQAQKRYAPEAGTLEINQFDVLRATGQEDWAQTYSRKDDDNATPLDLDKIRNCLDATYGGPAGEAEAYRQQAKLLIDYFGFARGDGNMEATSKHVACTVRMYAEKKAFGPDKGMLELGYHRREDLPKTFKALACAFAAAGLDDLASQFRHSRLLGWSFCFKSRHRETFNGLDIVLYSEKWEWQFDHDTANALKLFLGQYGA